jgi:transcriptional regulator with XRE-family HTH domain
MNERVAANLKRLRASRGWSQEYLAEVAGLSGRTVQRAERSGELTHDTRRALSSAFHVTASDLDGLDGLDGALPDMPVGAPGAH